jgi:hypothetical protein
MNKLQTYTNYKDLIQYFSNFCFKVYTTLNIVVALVQRAE